MIVGTGGRARRLRDRLRRPQVLVPMAAGVGAFALAAGTLFADLPWVAAALAGGGALLTTWASVRAAQPQVRAPGRHSRGDEGPMWRLPGRIQMFTGREDELDCLTAALERGRRPDRVALTGIGGVGKTSLALEYAHRVSPGTGLTAWIPAADRAGVVTALAGIGADLAVVADDPEATARRTLTKLHQREPWLLIYDDATPASVDGLLPATGAGRVVITSRRDDWSRWAEIQPVEPLPEPEAVALLLRRSGDTSPTAGADAAALATELGHLPLAVDLAGGFCGRYRVPLADYATLHRERGLSLLRGDRAAGPGVVAARLGTDRLARDDAAAVQLLRLLSRFAPGYLPQDVVTDNPEPLPAALAAAASDAVAWRELLARVADAGLIRVEPERLWTHQLVQQVQRDEIKERTGTSWRRWRQRLRWAARRADGTAWWPAGRWSTLATRLLSDQFPDEWNRPDLWPRCRELLPHARLALDHPGVPPLDTAALAHNLASYQYDIGDYAAAVDLLTRALDARSRILDDDHPDTLSSLNDLASAHLSQGDVDTAADLQTEVLETSRRTLGNDHPDTLSSMNNLAIVRRDQGDLDTAADLHTRVLEIRRTLGNDDPHTLGSIDNLAIVRAQQGDLGTAADLHTESLETGRRVMGDDHPDTLNYMSNLANARADQGNLDTATDLHTQALDGRRRVLGDDHPHTLSSRHNLALVRREQGDLDAAADLLTQALDGRRRILGDDHPHTLSSMWNLANVLEARGEPEAADRLRGEHDTRAAGRFVARHEGLVALVVDAAEGDAEALEELDTRLADLPEDWTEAFKDLVRRLVAEPSVDPPRDGLDDVERALVDEIVRRLHPDQSAP